MICARSLGEVALRQAPCQALRAASRSQQLKLFRSVWTESPSMHPGSTAGASIFNDIAASSALHRRRFSAAAIARSTPEAVQHGTISRSPLPAEQEPASPGFVPRSRFSFPESAPSWYAGHMHRAARSLPSLLRQAQKETGKAPLIVEVRDARLCLTSINPFFEKLLARANSELGSGAEGAGSKGRGREGASANKTQQQARARRLVVYTKADLIDKQLHEPIKRALLKHGDAQADDIIFIDTRVDGDVRRVLGWATRAYAARTSGRGARRG